MTYSDESYYLERMKKAEKLRKSHGMVWSWLWKPDYYGSAEIFEELADGSDNLEEKERLYSESARTFLMKKGEYSHFRAAEIYKKMMEIFITEDCIPKALEYGELYSNNLENTGRHMMAGQASDDLADLCESSMPEKAIEYRERAISLYKMDGNCPYHLKKSNEKCLMLQLSKGDYKGAIESLENHDGKYSALCRQMLALVTDSQIENDLDSSAESNLMRVLINRSHEEGLHALEEFSNDNYLPEYARHIFQVIAGRFSPENDIC
ncbi:hypothetical protein PAEPH01_0753 [Pancytospora epiphaga]|nr:hypothetical protein PAEPH01_0753 [Pancytospora epiphaga]